MSASAARAIRRPRSYRLDSFGYMRYKRTVIEGTVQWMLNEHYWTDHLGIGERSEAVAR